MPQRGLERDDGKPRQRRTEHLLQCPQLGRVVRRRARPVGLDPSDPSTARHVHRTWGGRRDAAAGGIGPHQVMGLGMKAVPTDPGERDRPSRPRPLRRLEHEGGGALAEHGAGPAAVEGTARRALPSRRQHPRRGESADDLRV